MNGTAIPEGTVAEFRALYLISGNATQSGKKLGMKERTARQIAAKFQTDPEFAAERRALRAQYLDDLVAMRMRVVTKALDRFLAPLPMPKDVSADAGITIIDRRPDYGKIVLDAEKNAHALSRLDAERDGTIVSERDVRITVVGPDDGTAAER